MPCLYCLTAHPRGRFWFCNRCGQLMLLCPVPAHEVCPPGTTEQAAGAGERGRRSRESERSLLEAVRRLKLRQEAAAVPLDAFGPRESDVPEAVVLDLDAARRVRQERTF
jgi:hypothetical protein